MCFLPLKLSFTFFNEPVSSPPALTRTLPSMMLTTQPAKIAERVIVARLNMIHIRSPLGAPFAARDHPLAPVAAAFQDEASTGLPIRRKPLTAITSLPRHNHIPLPFEARRRASSTADGHTLPVRHAPATKACAIWPERTEKTGKGISRFPAQHHRLQSQSTPLRDILCAR